MCGSGAKTGTTSIRLNHGTIDQVFKSTLGGCCEVGHGTTLSRTFGGPTGSSIGPLFGTATWASASSVLVSRLVPPDQPWPGLPQKLQAVGGLTMNTKTRSIMRRRSPFRAPVSPVVPVGATQSEAR